MNLSKSKIILFFLTVGFLTWLLYPNEFFMAYIYEGRNDLLEAEKYYLAYLEKKPLDKYANLQLASLYEKMADPDRAANRLENLINQRPEDFELAIIYLDLLENFHFDEKRFHEILRLSEVYLANPKFDTVVLIPFLEDALDYAKEAQDYESAYKIINNLLKISKNKGLYLQERADLDRGLKRTKRLIDFFQSEIERDPKNLHLYKELANIYIAIGDFKNSQETLEAGLKQSPQDKDLLNLIIQTYSRQKNFPEMLEVIQLLLKNQNLDDLERLNLEETMAFVFIETKLYDKAKIQYEKLIKADPENKDLWQGLLLCLEKIGPDLEFENTLILFYEKFPQDLSVMKQLVDRWLYIEKRLDKEDFLLKYIQQTEDLEVALDFGYLLQEQRNYKDTLAWINQVRDFFPLNFRLSQLEIDTLIKLENYSSALERIETLLKVNPGSSNLLNLALDLNLRLKQTEKAINVLQQLVVLAGDNCTKIYNLAKEFHYLKEDTTALQLTSRCLKKSPSIELYGLQAIIHLSRNEKNHAEQNLKNLLDLTSKNQKLSLEEKRYVLLAKGTLNFNHEVEQEYKKLIKDYPSDIDLNLNLLGHYLQSKNLKKAKALLKDLEGKPHLFASDWSSEKAQIALMEKKWSEALFYLNKLRAKFPNDLNLLSDLAYVKTQNGDWQEALNDYDTLWSYLKENSPFPTVPLGFIDLTDRFDHQVSSQFTYRDFGSDDTFIGSSQIRISLNKNWRLVAEGQYQFNEINSLNQTGKLGEAFLGTEYIFNNSTLIGTAIGMASSSQTTTPEIKLWGSHQFSDKLSFNLASKFFGLKDDLPQSLPFSAKSHDADLSLFWQPSEKWSLGSNAHLYYHFISNGDHAYETSLSQEVFYKILNSPDWRIGYRFNFTDVNASGTFLTSVPLISRAQRHFIDTRFSHWFFRNRLFAEASLFIGHDPIRSLNFYEGDLWGSSSALRWRIHDNLWIKGTYYFGKESPGGRRGAYQETSLSLTGHWH